jgi:acetyltransferase-like isoleucine patch superfamily enzyme
MSVSISDQQKELSSRNPFLLYRSLSVGDQGSWISLLGYELYQHFCSDVSGMVGLGLRSVFLPYLLQRAKRPVVGKGVLFRGIKQIILEPKVVIDDYAALDVRGVNGKIMLNEHVFLGRFSSVVSKNADIMIDKGTNIGTHCRLASQSRITIGASTLIAAYCYIGPGNHGRSVESSDRERVSIIEQAMEIRGGVTIGSNCWIGTGATILDGVTIGDGAIIGAHSLVRDDVPAGTIAVGTPARIL